MNRLPQRAAHTYELAPGVSAVSPGLLLLHASRALVAADLHFAYEDVIGGALPVWSTSEIVGTLLVAVQRTQAREIVLLGDVVHGTRMSEGAARSVAAALATLRANAQVTIVAGNHEGRTRAVELLGETEETIERDGWTLLHGDKPCAGRNIIGHLHPSLSLGGGASSPAFLASASLIVVPALTPYSAGLNVLSESCFCALRAFGIESRRDLQVVVAAGELLYPFGSLAGLRGALKWLRPDG